MSFLLCLLSLIPSDVESQIPTHAWSTFRREQGLLHNFVTSIAEAPDGAIWFGGAYGVSRYDGVEWTHHTEANGLPGALVTHLMIDSNGRPWAASGEGFRGFRQGWVAYRQDDRWVPVTLGGDRRRPLVGELFTVGGATAIGTRGAGLSIEGEGGRLERLTTRDGLNSDDVECATVFNDGTVFLVHGLRGPGPPSTHLSKRDPSGVWSSWDPVPLARLDVISVASDARRRLWFGTKTAGLLMYDSQLESPAVSSGTSSSDSEDRSTSRQVEGWTTFTVDDGLPSNTIDALATGPDGTVWVGTPMGVARRGPGQVAFDSFTEQNALPSNGVMAVLVASDGTTWIGTRGGVARYAPTGWVVHRTPFSEQRFPVRIERSADGDLWASTSRGLFRAGGQGWELVLPFARPQPVFDLVSGYEGSLLGSGRPRHLGPGRRGVAFSRSRYRERPA